MSQGALHGDDVAAGGDKAGCVEVPEAVEREVGDLGALAGLAPLVADGVLVRGQPCRGLEHPAGCVLPGLMFSQRGKRRLSACRLTKELKNRSAIIALAGALIMAALPFLQRLRGRRRR
jgi:hypothetical protein